jgi:hypothetical protein
MYHGDDAKFNNIELLQQLYMNSISESGRRYDIARHVKRTSKYFAPKEVFFESAAEKEENTILDNQGDDTDILLEGHRQPEILFQYLSTSSSIPGNRFIIYLFIRYGFTMLTRYTILNVNYYYLILTLIWFYNVNNVFYIEC